MESGLAPLDPSWVRGWGSPGMLISPVDPAGKPGKGPYLLLITEFTLQGS